MRKEVRVGSHCFRSASQLTDYVKKLVARYPVNAFTSEDDTEFLKALVSKHHEAKEKIGCGIRTFQFKINPVFKICTSVFIVRTDGSEIDFSWKVCINGPPSQSAQVKKALRSSIAEQISHFKKENFPNGIAHCAISGERLTWNACNVDHCGPRTFQVLVDEWMTEENLLFEDIKVQNGKFIWEMLDSRQRNSWLKFHSVNAKLRLLSPSEHSKLPRLE